jgi:TetR/AcrR family tetracycline transcriptional repressor
MRRLAARLGVQAPALYWHVGDKGELLGLMAREIYRSAYASVTPAADWAQWLMGFGCALRSSFAAHRDGAKLCASAYPPASSDPAARTTEITAQLTAFGLSEAEALTFQASVISLALGWAMFEANGPMRAYLGGLMDIERSFEDGLLALVRGFERPSLAT